MPAIRTEEINGTDPELSLSRLERVCYPLDCRICRMGGCKFRLFRGFFLFRDSCGPFRQKFVSNRERQALLTFVLWRKDATVALNRFLKIENLLERSDIQERLLSHGMKLVLAWNRHVLTICWPIVATK